MLQHLKLVCELITYRDTLNLFQVNKIFLLVHVHLAINMLSIYIYIYTSEN
jgi:hypothetical protein